MKKFLLALSIVACIAPSAGAGTKETISEITKNIVKFGKELSSGISQGVDEGRKATESSDGAIVVTDYEGLSAHAVVEVKRLTPVKTTDEVILTLGIRNNDDELIRITGLDKEGALLLLDSEKYAYSLTKDFRNREDLTVPCGAAISHEFLFSGIPKNISAVRVWGKEFSVTEVMYAPSDAQEL